MMDKLGTLLLREFIVYYESLIVEVALIDTGNLEVQVYHKQKQQCIFMNNRQSLCVITCVSYFRFISCRPRTSTYPFVSRSYLKHR